ncbi:UbiA family prenyltransferase [Citrobacter sp. ESY80]
MSTKPFDAIDINVPLVVDLDGTLSKTDTLHEGIVSILFKKPIKIIGLTKALFDGKTSFKCFVTETVTQNADSFCYRHNLIDYLKSEKRKGREIHLVTASNQKIADSINEYLGIFDGVKGSDNQLNLKGVNKLVWLKDRFPQGFIYAGDHKADITIWNESKGVILVGNGNKFKKDIKNEIPCLAFEDAKVNIFKQWMKQLRLHQWAKNILIFIPIFLAHIANDANVIAKTILAFIAFGLIASATYIINDLADLEADRRHKTKRNRPLASGNISTFQGILGALILFLIGGIISINLSIGLTYCILIYVLLTLCYSFKLKRVPMLDVSIIGALFTLRIIMGSVLNDLPLSPWLNSFSALLFFSLALAKRHVEILKSDQTMTNKIGGRGYTHQDWPLTLAFGVSSAICSILIMLLFLTQEAMVQINYSAPEWLLIEPICVFLWVMRIWFLSHRKVLSDDPVIFAIKDKTSICLGFIATAGFMIASYL